MRRVTLPIVSLLLLVLAGCASTPGDGDAASPARRQANRITLEEIQQTQVRTSYELIRSLRPSWIAGRGSHSLTNTAAGQVMIYLDGTRAGGPEILHQIAAQDVASAQFLSASEAGARYGLNHTGGAILITTRQR